MTEIEFRILVLKRGFKSSAALARAANIEPQTLCDIQKGRRNTEKHKVKISQILGVPYSKLWGNKKTKAQEAFVPGHRFLT